MNHLAETAAVHRWIEDGQEERQDSEKADKDSGRHGDWFSPDAAYHGGTQQSFQQSESDCHDLR